MIVYIFNGVLISILVVAAGLLFVPLGQDEPPQKNPLGDDPHEDSK